MVWSLAWEHRSLHASEQLGLSATTETQCSKINTNFKKRVGRVEGVLSTDWFFLGSPALNAAGSLCRTHKPQSWWVSHPCELFTESFACPPTLNLPSWGADEACDLLWEAKVFLGHDKKFPPKGWLKTTEVYSHSFGGGKSEVKASTGSASSGNSGSHSFWWFLGLWLLHSNLCPHLHITCFSMSSALRIRISVFGLKPTTTTKSRMISSRDP